MMTHETTYQLIRDNCADRPWTSREFAEAFKNVKFTNRCKEMERKGEIFATKTIRINGNDYKGYQYLGKKAE